MKHDLAETLAMSQETSPEALAIRDVPIIDLFAGPGGLSYGFSSLRHEGVNFRVALSIEKDPVAHQTLLLRAFVRQFSIVPDEYYEFVRTPNDEKLAVMRDRFGHQWSEAEREAKCWELGAHPFNEVSSAIATALNGATNWVLLGGPPCQAYSLAGRSRMKGRTDFGSDHRHTLYREYLKIVAAHGPSVFIMENVKGILTSRHGAKEENGLIFDQILSDLRDPCAAIQHEVPAVAPLALLGYSIFSFSTAALLPELLKPKEFVVKSEDWGVPQRRHRVILLGLRKDLTNPPKILSAFFDQSRVTIEQVIGGMPRIRSRLSRGDDEFSWRQALRKSVDAISGQKAGVISRRTLAARLVRSKTPKRTGAHFAAGKDRFKPKAHLSWIWDPRLGGVIQHESRAHMPLDIARYYFCSCVASETGRSPGLAEFPKKLLPRHKNVKPKNGKKGKRDFADRFRVQIKGTPATTITSHICKDGHYYIHYDQEQCRSLTVREAARIQTFPDSYYFFGGRTDQYHQVGNAVPPLLASKLAKVVANVLDRNEKEHSFNAEKEEEAVV